MVWIKARSLFDAIKKICRPIGRIDRCPCREHRQKAFGVRHVADTMHVGIFKVRGSLGHRTIRQVRDESLDVAFKEAHGQYVLYSVQAVWKHANLGQPVIHRHQPRKSKRGEDLSESGAVVRGVIEKSPNCHLTGRRQKKVEPKRRFEAGPDFLLRGPHQRPVVQLSMKKAG
jgi:hypothetical protein